MPHHEQQHQPLHAPVSEVAKYLRDAHFPCNKKDLEDVARKNNAPADVIRAIEIMYDEKFTSMDDVERNLKSSEARHRSASEERRA